MKAAAATGAVVAMYTVPKFTSVHSRPAYAGITGAPCDDTLYFVRYEGSSGIIETPIVPVVNSFLTAAEYYGYDTSQGGSNDGASANTPDGLENNNSNAALFFLLRDKTGNVSLGTILDKPNSGSGGSADIKYSGLPDDRTWSQEDDDDRDDRDTHSVGVGGGDRARMTVAWNGCCTDGGMLSSSSGDILDCTGQICVHFVSHTRIYRIRIHSSGACFTIPLGDFCIIGKPKP